MSAPKFVKVVPDPRGLCPSCNGSGSEWPKRKDGKPDARYHWPVGPCPECEGQYGYRTEQEWREMGVA